MWLLCNTVHIFQRKPCNLYLGIKYRLPYLPGVMQKYIFYMHILSCSALQQLNELMTASLRTSQRGEALTSPKTMKNKPVALCKKLALRLVWWT